MTDSPEDLCRDLNRVASWLAMDDFTKSGASGFDAIALLGNEVVETLVVACRMAQAAPQARLVFAGGIGGATEFLVENLRHSEFRGVFGDGGLAASRPEADLYVAIARDALSIPEHRLLVDRASANSGQNVQFTLRLLKESGLERGTVVLIQDPFLLRRAAVTWDRERLREGLPGLMRILRAVFRPEVEPGPGGVPRLVEGQRRGTWTFERFIGLLLGEVARLHDDENGYGPRGRDYFDHVEIPGDVWESYLRVRESPLARLGIR